MVSVSRSEPAEVARRVLDLALTRPATLGSARLVCVDGPGGSGKTTLAAAVADLSPGTPVIHMDDLYDGWSGLRHVTGQLASLLRPLADDRPGTYRRYDWAAAAYAETVTVRPAPLLVLEGVGAGAAHFADLVTVLVWVWVPADLRLERGLDRDGADLRAQWEAWMRDEDELFAREGTAARADVLVDGTGDAVPRVSQWPRR